MVTLHMAANTRSLYSDVIAQNLPAMTQFCNIFCDSASPIPVDTLTASIDSFFKRLNDIVDLPIFDDDTSARFRAFNYTGEPL